MSRDADRLEAITVKEYLDQHYNKKYDIDALSKLIYKCPSQTIRIFKKYYRITPYAYYSARRLEEASDLLKNTDLTVKEIAFSLGFADEHYFSAAFKQQTGFNPSEFRKK